MYYGSGSSTAMLVLMVIAFIASIVITVFGYRMFVRTSADQRFSITDQTTWGPFFNFDVLLIEKIMKALYLFSASFTALSSLAVLIGMLFTGIPVSVFLVMLIVVPIAVILQEVLIRVLYESVMLKIITTRNTTEIRNMMNGGAPTTPAMPTTPGSFTPNAGFGAAPKAAPQVSPQQWTSPVQQVTAPPQAGGTKICPQCGNRLAASAKFCGTCGMRF